MAFNPGQGLPTFLNSGVLSPGDRSEANTGTTATASEESLFGVQQTAFSLSNESASQATEQPASKISLAALGVVPGGPQTAPDPAHSNLLQSAQPLDTTSTPTQPTQTIAANKNPLVSPDSNFGASPDPPLALQQQVPLSQPASQPQDLLHPLQQPTQLTQPIQSAPPVKTIQPPSPAQPIPPVEYTPAASAANLVDPASSNSHSDTHTAAQITHKGSSHFVDPLSAARSASASAASAPPTSTAAHTAPATATASKPQLPVQSPRYRGEDEQSKMWRAFFSGMNVPARRVKLSNKTVAQDESGIKQLLEAGCWKEACNLATTLLRELNSPQRKQHADPKEVFATSCRYHQYLAGAFIRLKQHRNALMSLAPLDKQNVAFSDMPFNLQLLKCEALGFDGNGKATPFAASSALLRLRMNIFKEREGEQSGHKNFRQLAEWWTRFAQVSTSLANCFLQLPSPNFASAVKVLREAILHSECVCAEAGQTGQANLAEMPETPETSDSEACVLKRLKRSVAVLYSFLGRVFLQYGNLDEGKKCFQSSTQTWAEHDQLDSSSSSSSQPLRPADNTAEETVNEALLLLASCDFSGALQLFSGALKADPSNLQNDVLVNGYCVAALYNNNVTTAVTTLEKFIKRDPVNNLTAGVVNNLSTLYDLTSSDPAAKKRLLASLIQVYASDLVIPPAP